MTTDNYRHSLKVVGYVLIVVGALDIGWMVYCVMNKLSYSSSVNIFAVVGGFFLIRGSLRAANVIAYFSAFLLTSIVGALLLFLLYLPMDLLIAYSRVDPFRFGGLLALTGFVAVLLVWIYQQLTAAPVIEAVIAAYPSYGNFWRRPRTGIIWGAVMVAMLVGVLIFVLRGSSADRAITEAKRKVGDGYQFQVTSINIRATDRMTHVDAVVTAYSKNEIREIPIEWDE